MGLRRVLQVRLKFLLESSGSTISLTVLTVINVKGVIAGPITKAGTFNGREKHLTGLTKQAFQDTRMVENKICGRIQKLDHQTILIRGSLFASISKQASVRHLRSKNSAV